MEKEVRKKLNKHITKIVEKETENRRVGWDLLTRETPKTFMKIFKEFLSNISEKQKKDFIALIDKMNSYTLLKKFERAILNYNFQNKFKKKSNAEGVRLLLLCVAIEGFFNFREDNKENNTKIFTSFFKNLSTTYKDLIYEKFTIRNSETNNENASKAMSSKDKKKILEKFPRFIYEKRSEFVHQGIHFSLCKNDKHTIFTSSKEHDNIIKFKLTFDDFLMIFEDCLYKNLKNRIETQKERRIK